MTFKVFYSVDYIDPIDSCFDYDEQDTVEFNNPFKALSFYWRLGGKSKYFPTNCVSKRFWIEL